jgi:hypothetical protein
MFCILGALSPICVVRQGATRNVAPHHCCGFCPFEVINPLGLHFMVFMCYGHLLLLFALLCIVHVPLPIVVFV